jgi:hypothetical protein
MPRLPQYPLPVFGKTTYAPADYRRWLYHKAAATCLAGLLLVFAPTTATPQAAFLITFNELSERPLDGVSVDGVTFHFNGSSPDSPQGLFGTTSLSYGHTVLMNAPWAEGSSDGRLRLDFANPATRLSFDTGLTTTAPLVEGFRVDFYQGTHLIDTIGVATSVNGLNPLQFSEAEFSYVSPGVPFTSASITFSPGLNFVFDNLSCTVVPEPESLAFSLATLAVITLARRRNLPEAKPKTRGRRVPP